jgi:extracellular matrix protein 14
MLCFASILLLSCAPLQSVAFPGLQFDQAAAKQQTPKLRNNVFPQWTRLRDTAIEAVFGAPPKAQNSQGGKSAPISRPSNSQLPATLLAKYGGDVVLRFNISTSEEERELSKAADTLFLDVWEFSDGWADIRLREDDVCHDPTPTVKLSC